MAGIQVPVIFKLGVQGNISGAISNAKKNLASGESMGAQAASSGALNSGIGKMAGSLSGILGAVMKIAGVALTLTFILTSSKMLIRVLEQLGKLISTLLRPIGDALAIVIAPIMMLLKPFAIMMNALMRPFLQDARKIFRMSQQARAAGDTSASNELMLKGATVLGLGFVNLLTVAIGEGMKFIVDLMVNNVNMLLEGFQFLGAALLSVVGASDQTIAAWNTFMNGLQETTTQTGEVIKAFIDVGVTGISESMTKLKDQLVLDANNIAKGLPETAKSFQELQKQLGAEGSTSIAVKAFYDELEELRKKTEENQVNFSNFKTSLENDVFGVLKSGVTGATEDAAKFKESLTNLFPSIPEGVAQTAASGLTLGPLDELASIFGGFIKGDWGEVVNGAIELINPLHNLFEWFNFLQDATKLLYGEGGAGFKELQVEVAKNIESMQSFGSTTSKAINAIDGAVGAAKNFMNQAQNYANQAAASASKAASAASSARANSSSSTKKVNDLIITSDGRTFETAPDDNIFATKGGMGGKGTTINLNIGTIQALNSDDVKRKLDELIRDNLRKYA